MIVGTGSFSFGGPAMKMNDKVTHVSYDHGKGVVKEFMRPELDLFVLVEWELPVDGSRLHWERQEDLQVKSYAKAKAVKKAAKKAAKKSTKKSVKKAKRAKR